MTSMENVDALIEQLRKRIAFNLPQPSKTNEKTLEYPCKICRKVFPSKQELNLHTQSFMHKEFGCYICHRSFDSDEQRKLHMEFHIDEKLYQCKVCWMCFNNPLDLELHELDHSKQLKFECRDCGLFFKNKSEIEIHNELHAPQYQCDQCLRCFVSKDVFNEHIKFHIDVKLFTCELEYCENRGVGFKYEHEKEYHLQARHPEEFRKLCIICRKRFWTNKELKVHIESEHPHCKICGAAFRNDVNVVKHTKANHPGYQCNVCYRRFMFDQDYAEHKQTCYIAVVQCALCSKFFRNTRDWNHHLSMCHVD